MAVTGSIVPPGVTVSLGATVPPGDTVSPGGTEPPGTDVGTGELSSAAPSSGSWAAHGGIVTSVPLGWKAIENTMLLRSTRMSSKFETYVVPAPVSAKLSHTMTFTSPSSPSHIVSPSTYSLPPCSSGNLMEVSVSSTS